MNKTIISLLLTVAISALIGLLTPNFLITFILATIVQIVGFYIGNTLYNNYIITKIENIKLDQIKELSKIKPSQTLVKCPCDKGTVQEIDISPNEEIVYKCKECDKSIKAYCELRNFVASQPIYFNDKS